MWAELCVAVWGLSLTEMERAEPDGLDWTAQGFHKLYSIQLLRHLDSEDSSQSAWRHIEGLHCSSPGSSPFTQASLILLLEFFHFNWNGEASITGQHEWKEFPAFQVTSWITGPFGSANCKIIRDRPSEASRVWHPLFNLRTMSWNLGPCLGGLKKRYKERRALITFH